MFSWHEQSSQSLFLSNENDQFLLFLQLKSVSSKEVKPQPKGQIAFGEESYDNSYSNEYSAGQQSPNSYYGQQSYYGNQPAQESSASQYAPDYTDGLEKQAVEEENALDTEAEKSDPSAYAPETNDHRNIDDTTEGLGDLTDPSNPLFGKYDVPVPTKASVFCPPCRKYFHWYGHLPHHRCLYQTRSYFCRRGRRVITG